MHERLIDKRLPFTEVPEFRARDICYTLLNAEQRVGDGTIECHLSHLLLQDPAVGYFCGVE